MAELLTQGPAKPRPQVLLLRGAPGVGKTRAARGLADVLGTGAVLEVDQLRAMFACGDWGSRRQHEVALRGAMALARQLLEEHISPVLVVDNFGRDSVERALRGLQGVDVEVRVVSLWAEESALIERLDARHVGFQDRGLASLMNEEVRVRRVPHDLLLDTTGLTSAAVVETLAGLLAGRVTHEGA